MKIVNRTTFLSMPAGTIFSKFHQHIFLELSIKGDSIGGDFYVMTPTDAIACDGSNGFWSDVVDRAVNGESIDMDFNCEQRDGCFNEKQLFAVWEKADVEKFAARIGESLAVFGDKSE